MSHIRLMFLLQIRKNRLVLLFIIRAQIFMQMHILIVIEQGFLIFLTQSTT